MPPLGLILLSVLGAVLSYWISLRVFHQAPMTTDENSYIFQANNFLSGQIAREAPPFWRAFSHEMIIIDRDAGWLSRYPPAHAVWLIPAVLLGDPYLMSALAAGLTVFVLAMTCRQIRISPYIGAFLALCCPYFLFTNGTLLSHTSGMLAASLLIYCYLHWRQSRRTVMALCAGLAWSWLYTNRTYTAFCVCIPFGIDAIIVLANQRTRQRLMGVVAFALASAAGAVALLAYNAAAVGDPFTMTYLFYDSTDGLGFGPRHIRASVSEFHTFKLGLKYYAENVGVLDEWMFGFRGSLLLAVILAFVGRSTRTPLLLTAPFAVWAGYICFWYPGVNVAGPTYYAESVPFLLIAASPGVARILELARRKTAMRYAPGVVGVALLAFSASSFSARATREIEPEFAQRARIIQTIHSAPPGSIVFIDMNEHYKYLTLNAQGLDSDPLILTPVSRQNETIARYFSDREIYRLHVLSRPKLEHKNLAATFEFGVRGVSAHRLTGENARTADGPRRVARSGQHDQGYLAYGVGAMLFPGRFICRYELTIDGCETGEASVILDVASSGGRIIHASHEIRGNLTNQVVGLDFEVDDFSKVEPRVYYAGCGNVTLNRIKLMASGRSHRDRAAERVAVRP